MKINKFFLLASTAIFFAATLFLFQKNKTHLIIDSDEPGEIGGGYYKQWFEHHKNENGEIPTGLQQKWYAHDLAERSRLSSRGASPILSVAQLVSESTAGGRTRALIVDKRNVNTFFAGSVSGGLWKTTDGGQNWLPINDAQSNLSVTCLTQNPLKPTEIYYGTGENRNTGQPTGSGIFKSSDGGLTFDLLKNTEGVQDMTRCNVLTHSPTSDSTLYVGTYNGLYRSISAGETWTKVLAGSINGIVCLPTGRVVVGVQGGSIFAADDGKTFTAVNNAAFPTSSIAAVSVANCAGTPTTIYAFFGDASYSAEGNRGVFKSIDGGKTWAKRSDGTTTNATVGPTYTAYCQTLGVNPTDPDQIVIGAVFSKASLNGGLTWNSLALGHADIHALSNIDATNFLLGTDGGVYKFSWSGLFLAGGLNNGYNTLQYYGGHFAPSGTLAIGGTQDNGTWRVERKFAAQVNGSDGGFSYISQQDSNLAYAATQNGYVSKTSLFTNSAYNFSDITPAGRAEGVDFINFYNMNDADGKQLFYGTRAGVWRTLNSGTKWERLNNANVQGIAAIGVEAAADPSVFLGGANCFYRIDKAASFGANGNFTDLRASYPTGFSNDYMGSINFHPSNRNILYVGITSITNRDRVVKITDAQSANPKWQLIGGNLPRLLPAYSVQAHPDRPENVLFAATAFGLYFTTDGGVNWIKETRIPNVAINEMKLRKSDRTLFLFTHGRGAWQIKLTDFTTTTAEVFKTIKLEIYPNPTTDFLNIDAEGPLSILQVFDVNGREILSSKEVQSINVSQLSKGIYFLKAFDKTGQFSTIKFVKN